MALNGSRLLWCLPETYHEYMPITTEWSPKSKIIYDQLAACYMLFAFNQAVILRVVHDVYVWKVLLFGMALSDVAYMYSILAEMGRSGFLSPENWRLEDWFTVGSTAGPLFLRIAFIFGIGLRSDRKEKTKA